jgi:hypothetical protein
MTYDTYQGYEYGGHDVGHHQVELKDRKIVR